MGHGRERRLRILLDTQALLWWLGGDPRIKGKAQDLIADPVRFTGFVGNLAKHVTVDTGLSDAEIRSTALSLRLRSDDIELLQAPLRGFGTSPSGESIDLVDQDKLRELSEALQQDTMDRYVAKYPQG